MTDASKPDTRRTLLIGAAALTGLAVVAQPKQARAAGTMPKTNVKFQVTPNNGNYCGKCNYFLPGASPKAAGLCKIVAGPITPTGWCILFAPKPH